MVQCMWPIYVCKIDKNVTEGVNLTNLKTIGGYITKLKPSGQFANDPNLKNYYVIWSYFYEVLCTLLLILSFYTHYLFVLDEMTRLGKDK